MAVAETDDVVLYSYWRSSCSWRVRIALNLKEIDFQTIPIHLVKNIQLSEEYTTDKNPRGLVPTLKIDGHTLTESMAIILYLNDRYPDISPLLSSDPWKKAQSIRLAEIVNSGIQSIQNLAVLRYVMNYFDEAELKKQRKMEWGKHWIDKGFQAFEQHLEETAGKYCLGDEVTLADLFLVPQVYNANRFKVDMSQFPNITRINENLSKLEAFQKAHPDQQPDAQN